MPRKLVELSVPRVAWTLSPVMVREMIEGHVDLAPQSSMGWSILGKPGYVPEEQATALDDGLWHRTDAS